VPEFFRDLTVPVKTYKYMRHLTEWNTFTYTLLYKKTFKYFEHYSDMMKFANDKNIFIERVEKFDEYPLYPQRPEES
jgi:hypothetical protein